MDIKFSAIYFDASSEDEVLTVALSDNAHEPEDFLILQRATEVDEQDVELGQDTYHVEIGNPGLAGYGGVDEVFIANDRLTFVFSDAVAWCKSIKTLEVRLSSQAEITGDLADLLGAVFAGQSTRISRS
ncbi:MULTISPECIES: Imm10 family immunity protein [unclassified Pseudomonas]|uniref:Imm10 family immunity protein n=1 Tax=unclassified Pseudomonas TaxID=196821 RepID=UPI000CD12F2E|nr:Imm10 family immunity protein [Pseudomonas sp. MPR-ANC1]POA49001.1 hypothetical protein C1893_08790 [Pseudomonas sp. MPR-ANC1]